MTIISEDKTINKILLGGGTFVGILMLAKYVSAETQGSIVASEPLLYGQCVEGACLTDTEVIAYVTFKNVGGVYKENVVGISVNGVSVKEQTVGLNPGTGFTMAYTFTMSSGVNNICGIVS
jgi:hypothetical protein